LSDSDAGPPDWFDEEERESFPQPVSNLPSLTEEQQNAADAISHFVQTSGPSSYFTLHGYAGTGKTVTLSHIAHKYPTAWLCALSGKAADVLRRKTGKPATTIHSLFYDLKGVQRQATKNPFGDDNLFFKGREDMAWARAHEDEKLNGQIVLLDECSMVGERMAKDILAMGCKVVAVGDPGQLPPVQDALFFKEPNASLVTIHRQALESPIIRQAHLVRLGKGYKNDTEDFQVQRSATKEQTINADIIICWKNDTRHRANAYKRKLLGYTQPYPVAGEPVMCLKNYPDKGIFNGATYTLTRDFKQGDTRIYIDAHGHELDIHFAKFEGVHDDYKLVSPDTSFCWCYAATCHKTQGSEWNTVMFLDEYPRYRHDYINFAYTAITRSAKRIIVVTS